MNPESNQPDSIWHPTPMQAQNLNDYIEKLAEKKIVDVTPEPTLRELVGDVCRQDPTIEERIDHIYATFRANALGACSEERMRQIIAAHLREFRPVTTLVGDPIKVQIPIGLMCPGTANAHDWNPLTRKCRACGLDEDDYAMRVKTVFLPPVPTVGGANSTADESIRQIIRNDIGEELAWHGTRLLEGRIATAIHAAEQAATERERERIVADLPVAFRAAFATINMEIAGRIGQTNQWSASDLTTDLVPIVAARIREGNP